MTWTVEFTEEFAAWFASLSVRGQNAVDRGVHLLQQRGPTLPEPYSKAIKGSRHGHMRELRIQSKGRPVRVLYAFDPRRAAILLVGGDKGGKGGWYEMHIPIADRLYDAHLAALQRGRRASAPYPEDGGRTDDDDEQL